MTTSTTVNDISDIVRILKEQPEWADTLRGVLLSEEILKLPEMVAALVESNKLILQRLDGLENRMDGQENRMGSLENRMEGVEAEIIRLSAEVNRLNGQVSNLIGSDFENKAYRNITGLVHAQLGITRIRVLKSIAIYSPDIINNLIDKAEEEGRISDDEGLQLSQVDIILSAVLKHDKSRVGVAIEVSRTIDDDDITRARHRADILAVAVGTPVIAAVLGGAIHPPQQSLADQLGVQAIVSPENLRS